MRSAERQTQMKCHCHPNRFIIQTEVTGCNRKREKPIATTCAVPRLPAIVLYVLSTSSICFLSRVMHGRSQNDCLVGSVYRQAVWCLMLIATAPDMLRRSDLLPLKSEREWCTARRSQLKPKRSKRQRKRQSYTKTVPAHLTGSDVCSHCSSNRSQFVKGIIVVLSCLSNSTNT